LANEIGSYGLTVLHLCQHHTAQDLTFCRNLMLRLPTTTSQSLEYCVGPLNLVVLILLQKCPCYCLTLICHVTVTLLEPPYTCLSISTRSTMPKWCLIRLSTQLLRRVSYRRMIGNIFMLSSRKLFLQTHRILLVRRLLFIVLLMLTMLETSCPDDLAQVSLFSSTVPRLFGIPNARL
jgi:hypothetical protein